MLEVALQLHESNPHTEIRYGHQLIVKADIAAKRRWLSRGQWLQNEQRTPIANPVANHYSLEFDLKRLDNTGGFQIRFPIANTAGDLHLADGMHYSSDFSGLGVINGVHAAESPDRIEGDPFADGQVHRIGLKVTPESVLLSVDDAAYVDWKGDPSAITSYRMDKDVPAELHFTQSAKFFISNLEFTEE